MEPIAKPKSPSCERNRDAILAVLKTYCSTPGRVLEIGSGTGQHAVYFAEALPNLSWQCSDLDANLPGIRLWIDEAGLPNTPPPFGFDVQGVWPLEVYDGVFSANSLHIMAWEAVVSLFAGLPAILSPAAWLMIYGPFNYGGRFTSDSNAQFNDWLQGRGAHMAIRDFEAVDELARRAGLSLVEDREMPANNRMLIWRVGG